MKKVIIILVIIFSLISINEAAVLLESDYGTRPISMGGSYVSVGGDPVSIFWNPAGMPEPNFYGIVTLGYQRKLSDMNMFELFGTYKKYLGGYWGIGFVRWGASEMGWNDYNEESGLIDASEYLVGVAYKRSFFGIISAGATLKYDYNRIVDSSENTIALDIGARSVVEGIGIGFVIKNIGIGATDLPIGMVLGGSYTVYRYLFHTLFVSVELSSVQGIGFIMRGGLEYNYKKLIFVRLGYNALSSTHLGIFSKLRMGVGFKYMGGDLSYAFLPYGKLGYTHEVNITYNIDNLYKKSKADEIKPMVKLMADKNLITGMGDNRMIVFNIEAKDETALKSWLFEIKDKDGKVVFAKKEDNLEGIRYKLKQIEWNGKSMISGGKKYVPDGKYKAIAKVTDYGDNVAYDSIDEILVYTSRYAIILNLNTDILLKGDTVKISLLKPIRYRQKAWRLIIRDEKGNIVFETKGKGRFKRYRWNGKDKEENYVSPGKYKIKLEITFSNNQVRESTEKIIEVK